MPRLIDAGALIAEMHNVILEDGDDRSTFYEVIERQPTIAQPEIIRCRECKHYAFADNRAFGFPAKRCEWTGFEDVDDDDFCSRAERREESNESKERS